MNGKAEIFDKTYEDYLKQLSEINLYERADILGADISGNDLIIPFYGEPYKISASGITDSRGRQANFSISVALCKYILLCPEQIPTDGKWVTYREFKDAGPLTVYFANNTNKIIETTFPENPETLEKSCRNLGGVPYHDNAAYDLSMVFNALPRIAVLLRFNFKDDDFPSQCTVLFRQSAENSFQDRADILEISLVTAYFGKFLRLQGFLQEGGRIPGFSGASVNGHQLHRSLLLRS